MSPDILNGVRYRIQNADFGTFLERRGKSTLVLRNLKEQNTRQQWDLKKVEGSDTYELQNASDNDWVLSGKLSEIPSGSLMITKRSATSAGKKWKLVYDGLQPQIYMISSDLGDEDVLAFVDSSNTPAIERDSGIQDLSRINKSEEYRWKLVEVTPASLPDGDGKYRIRTLNGQAVHSLPGKKELSTTNQQRGDHRAWEIKNLGNGKCTVFNVQEKKFLSTEKDRSGEWMPVLSAVEQKWNIRVNSEFTWSIFIEHQISNSGIPVPLSLSLKDQTVILKPMKAAHNQIWLIEPTDAPIDNGSTGGNTGGGIDEIIQGSGLRPGEYKLQNNGPERFTVFLKINNTAGTFDVLAGRGDSEYSDFKVELKSGGRRGEVVIYYSANSVTRYLAVKDGILVGNTTAYFWIIELGPNSMFYICCGDSPELVLGTANSANKFVINQKTAGPSNLWSFYVPN